MPMLSLSEFLNNTLLKKVLMSFTGLFLILFLIGHLAGNLQLLIPNNQDVTRLQFNAYAKFMTTNPAVRLLSYVTYLSVLVHVLFSILLTVQNSAARPIGYKRAIRVPVAWASKNMGVLGTFILLFLVVHMRSFWYEMHWGALGVDANGNRDLYELVVVACQQAWYVAFYVLSMALLGFHLAHGFWSAFHSLGFYHHYYTPLLRVIGVGFAWVVPALFALIPVVLYLRSL